MENSSDIIEKVIIRLLRTNGVFYASLVQQCQRIELKGEQAKQLNTCGVTIKNGRILLYWNPKFFETLTLDEARAVLEHEMAHLVRSHVERFKDKDAHIGNLACVPPDTFLIGPNKRIDETEAGEFVLSERGNLIPIHKVLKRKYKGNLIKVTPSNLLPAKFTDEHPLLVCRNRFKASSVILGTPQWILAKDLKVGDYVLVPKLQTKTYMQVDFSPYIQLDKGRIPGNTKLPLTLPLTEELAWIMGFYVAEGSWNQYGGIAGINFATHPKKDKAASQRIIKYFEQFGFKVRIHYGHEAKNPFKTAAKVVRVYSSLVGRAFSVWFGRGSHFKKIPDFILFNSDTKIRKAFLEGYQAGDGHKTEKYDENIMGTVSHTLARQVQLLILSLGDNNFASVNLKEHNGMNGGYLYNISHRQPKKIIRNLMGKEIESYNHRWKDFGLYFALPIRKIEVEKYKGFVYNLQTDDHTFCVNNMITHNCDLAQNQFISGLPKDSVQLDKFPKEWKLKEKETAEYYYDEFMKHANKISVTQNKDGSYHVKITDPKGKTIAEFDVNDMDGSEWKDSDGGELSKEVVRQAVKEAVDQMKKSQGTLPQGLDIAVNEILQPPKISWNQLLRQYIAASIKSGSRQSWKKPNRRFGATQKGRIADHIIAISVGIDTSGSIGAEEYKTFFSELRAIQECYKADINVLECDAEVQRHYKLNRYKKGNRNVKGGGGTDFTPMFEYLKKKKIRTDVFVVFTDGYGTFPTAKYPFKTIWVLTSELDKVPFGRVIRIKDYPARGK